MQVAPASLRFDRGAEHIVGLRLSPKGLYRWYADCCKTPLGNTLKPGVPFVGIVAQAFVRPDEVFGRPTGAVQGRFAIGTPPAGSTGFPVMLLARALGKVLGWKLRGRTWPHPFFDSATGEPSRPVSTLSRAERDAARALSGPRPESAPA